MKPIWFKKSLKSIQVHISTTKLMFGVVQTMPHVYTMNMHNNVMKAPTRSAPGRPLVEIKRWCRLRHAHKLIILRTVRDRGKVTIGRLQGLRVVFRNPSLEVFQEPRPSLQINKMSSFSASSSDFSKKQHSSNWTNYSVRHPVNGVRRSLL